jgi:hypothetical protein
MEKQVRMGYRYSTPDLTNGEVLAALVEPDSSV